MLGLSTLGMLITPIMFGLGSVVIYNGISISSNVIMLAIVSGTTWVISNIYQTTKIMKSSIFLKIFQNTKNCYNYSIFSILCFLHTVSALYAVFDLI